MIRAIRADTYDGGRWLRLPATTVREWRYYNDSPWEEWKPRPTTPLPDELWNVWQAKNPHLYRTGTVSPVLPADLTELWVGVEQYIGADGVWRLGRGIGKADEIRLALIYRCAGVTVLRVVGPSRINVEDPDHPLHVLVTPEKVWRWHGHFYENVTAEPWAADLVPGDVVLDLGTVEAIDPITEMVCALCLPDGVDGEYRAYRNARGRPDTCPKCSNTDFVPLVLPSDRITEIEVP